jgi:hypothetical protein
MELCYGSMEGRVLAKNQNMKKIEYHHHIIIRR